MALIIAARIRLAVGSKPEFVAHAALADLVPRLEQRVGHTLDVRTHTTSGNAQYYL